MVLKIQNNMPKLKNEKETYVLLQGSNFQQNNVIIKINNNVINIYCVYKLVQYQQVEMILLVYKILYLELCKLLKMLILVNISTKDMVVVSTEMHCLA